MNFKSAFLLLLFCGTFSMENNDLIDLIGPNDKQENDIEKLLIIDDDKAQDRLIKETISTEKTSVDKDLFDLPMDEDKNEKIAVDNEFGSTFLGLQDIRNTLAAELLEDKVDGRNIVEMLNEAIVLIKEVQAVPIVKGQSNETPLCPLNVQKSDEVKAVDPKLGGKQNAAVVKTGNPPPLNPKLVCNVMKAATLGIKTLGAANSAYSKVHTQVGEFWNPKALADLVLLNDPESIILKLKLDEKRSGLPTLLVVEDDRVGFRNGITSMFWEAAGEFPIVFNYENEFYTLKSYKLYHSNEFYASRKNQPTVNLVIKYQSGSKLLTLNLVQNQPTSEPILLKNLNDVVEKPKHEINLQSISHYSPSNPYGSIDTSELSNLLKNATTISSQRVKEILEGSKNTDLQLVLNKNEEQKNYAWKVACLSLCNLPAHIFVSNPYFLSVYTILSIILGYSQYPSAKSATENRK